MLGTDKALKSVINVQSDGGGRLMLPFEYSQTEEGYVGHLDCAKGCFIFSKTFEGLVQSLKSYWSRLAESWKC